MLDICTDCQKGERLTLTIRSADHALTCPHRNYSKATMEAKAGDVSCEVPAFGFAVEYWVTRAHAAEKKASDVAAALNKVTAENAELRAELAGIKKTDASRSTARNTAYLALHSIAMPKQCPHSGLLQHDYDSSVGIYSCFMMIAQDALSARRFWLGGK